MEYFIILLGLIGIYFAWNHRIHPLLCKACGKINDVGDITADNHIHCKCGAIFKVSSLKIEKRTSTLKTLAHIKPADQPLLNDNAEDDIQRPNNDALNRPLTNEVATMQSANTITTSDTSAIEKPSSLRWLPVAFYIIASLGFLGWIIIALKLESWVAFGYGIGSTIACFAGGRTIELLQNIDDELYRKRMSR